MASHMFAKAVVTEVGRFATLELESGRAFKLPSTYVADGNTYRLDVDDEVYIHVVTGNSPSIICIMPFEDGGLAVTLDHSTDGVFKISKIEAVDKSLTNDL